MVPSRDYPAGMCFIKVNSGNSRMKNNIWNMFKVNSEDTRTTSVTSNRFHTLFRCNCRLGYLCLHLCWFISIIKVNANWVNSDRVGLVIKKNRNIKFSGFIIYKFLLKISFFKESNLQLRTVPWTLQLVYKFLEKNVLQLTYLLKGWSVSQIAFTFYYINVSNIIKSFELSML